MKILLIAGASGSGKSYICGRFAEKLRTEGLSVSVISMDNYYKERPSEVPLREYQETTNFDTPTALKLDTLVLHLQRLAMGEDIEMPCYSFTTCQVEDTQTMRTPQVVIVEGSFALHLLDKLPELDTASAFVSTASYQTILRRRIARDTGGDRGDRSPELIQQFERNRVGPAFFQHIASTMCHADIQLVNDDNSQETLVRDMEYLVEEIRESCGRPSDSDLSSDSDGVGLYR